MRSPLDEESSNTPALLPQTASRVTLGLDVTCHSQKFKLAALGARVHLPAGSCQQSWSCRAGGTHMGGTHVAGQTQLRQPGPIPTTP